MKQILRPLALLCMSLLMSNKTNAQELSSVEIRDNISRINFSTQGIYFSFEKKLAPVISLYTDIGLGLSYGRMNSSEYHLAVSPIIATEGRWYFTYKRRYDKGKKTLLNSAEFLSLQTTYRFKSIAAQGPDDYPAVFFLSAYMGLQRTWGKHFNFELKLGYGIGYMPESSSVIQGYVFNLKLGYVFNKS